MRNINVVEYAHAKGTKVTFVIFSTINDVEVKAHNAVEAHARFCLKYPGVEVSEVVQLPFE